jgi:nitrite reductase (NADH) small subunit
VAGPAEDRQPGGDAGGAAAGADRVSRRAAPTRLHEVGAFDDLPEGRPAIVEVGGRQFAIVRLRGEVYALRNVCPHQTQSYAGGRAHSRIEGADRVGELQLLVDDPVLACPWHGWEFRLRGGECLVDPKLRVRTYPTVIREGRVYVDVGSGAAPAEPD